MRATRATRERPAGPRGIGHRGWRLGLGLALATATVGLPRTLVAGGPPLSGPAPLPWRGSTSSPSPSGAAPHGWANACGSRDAALDQVASRVALGALRGEVLPRSDELAFLLRTAGQPHVWPRAWTVRGAGLSDAELATRFERWAAAVPTAGERRCGTAEWRAPDGTRLAAAIAVDAVADLAPLPLLARAGQWLSFESTANVPAQGATVVLLGPRGRPRSVLASVDGSGKVRSRFALDQPGRWLVQLLLETDAGPRPALEALVFVSEPPPEGFAESEAPGEGLAATARDDEEAMRRLTDAARRSESLAPLTREPLLDRLAREHSERMMRSAALGHDVGGGTPTTRMKQAGLRFGAGGENVAVASSIVRAHRALWASPSHRGNLLETRYRRGGVGVTRGDDGRVWVTLLFAD